jgi:hypothetical protein
MYGSAATAADPRLGGYAIYAQRSQSIVLAMRRK